MFTAILRALSRGLGCGGKPCRSDYNNANYDVAGTDNAGNRDASNNRASGNPIPARLSAADGRGI